MENIGEKFEYYKFKNLRNPFGILFHPKAVESFIINAVDNKKYSEDDIFFHNEQWHSYDAHSKLSHHSKDGLLQNLNNSIEITNAQIKEASHIIITLGTAWVYNHHLTNLPVANCHKVPQKEFKKQLLSVSDITESLQSLLHQVQQINPKVHFIFTVSPVRHIKDGFVENMQSKAHLITAIHGVISNHNNFICSYFPSYEIMMDELRDYRFYSEDMLHPNRTAVDYIWEKFQKVWLHEDTQAIMNEVETIQKGIQHRPFNPQSEVHQKFLKQLETKKKHLHNSFPHIQFP